MNYLLAAAALRAASLNSVTRSLYSALTRMRSGPRNAYLDRALWVLDQLPDEPQRLLDLGTGWAHVYSLYPALLRNDEIHTFDTRDLRHWGSFKATLPMVHAQLKAAGLPANVIAAADERFERYMRCADWPAFYAQANMVSRVDPTGSMGYPENHFDRVFSVDVLEHVDRDAFPALCRDWYRVVKPGGKFVAQVGLDDHTMFYTGTFNSKRYMRYSDRAYRTWLGNSVQYINRLPASQILRMLSDAGFVLDEVSTHKSGDVDPKDVHPDYASQSGDDIRAARLLVRARKP